MSQNRPQHQISKLITPMPEQTIPLCSQRLSLENGASIYLYSNEQLVHPIRKTPSQF